MVSTSQQNDPDETIRKLLNDLWQRLLPQTTERLSLLDQVAATAPNATLSPAMQHEAAAIAHKFAGSLGMFGFHESTRLALELEQYLLSPSPDPPTLARLTSQLRRSLPL